MPDQEQRSSDWEQDRGYALVPRGSEVVSVDVGAATSGVPWILFLLLIVLLTLTSSAYYVAWRWAAADARHLASVEQAEVWLQRLDTHAVHLKAGRPDSFAELRGPAPPYGARGVR